MVEAGKGKEKKTVIVYKGQTHKRGRGGREREIGKGRGGEGRQAYRMVLNLLCLRKKKVKLLLKKNPIIFCTFFLSVTKSRFSDKIVGGEGGITLSHTARVQTCTIS